MHAKMGTARTITAPDDKTEDNGDDRATGHQEEDATDVEGDSGIDGDRRCAELAQNRHMRASYILWSRTGPELVQNRSRTGPGLVQNWPRTGPELAQKGVPCVLRNRPKSI